MVLDTGFEPVRNLIRGILSPLCLANFTNPAYRLSFQAVINCYSVLGLVCHRESVESGAGSEIRTRNATLEELSVTFTLYLHITVNPYLHCKDALSVALLEDKPSFGAGCQIRTDDLCFTRALLYQLS